MWMWKLRSGQWGLSVRLKSNPQRGADVSVGVDDEDEEEEDGDEVEMLGLHVWSRLRNEGA